VGEVKPEGVVTGEAVAAAGAEDDVEGAELFGDGGGPAEEEVGDDEEFAGFVLYEDVAEEVCEGGFEGGGGLDEANDEVVGYGVGVLCVGRETVLGGSERDF